ARRAAAPRPGATHGAALAGVSRRRIGRRGRPRARRPHRSVRSVRDGLRAALSLDRGRGAGEPRPPGGRVKRRILTALALGLLVVENGFDFVGSVPYFRRITGGLGILDMLPFPDAARAHRALAALGVDGRHQYVLLLVTFDVLFPLTLA